MEHDEDKRSLGTVSDSRKMVMLMSMKLVFSQKNILPRTFISRLLHRNK